MTNSINLKKSMAVSLAIAGQSQNWVAEQLEENKSTVSRWANADHLSTRIILRLAHLFDISVSTFIERGEQ